MIKNHSIHNNINSFEYNKDKNALFQGMKYYLIILKDLRANREKENLISIKNMKNNIIYRRNGNTPTYQHSKFFSLIK